MFNLRSGRCLSLMLGLLLLTTGIGNSDSASAVTSSCLSAGVKYAKNTNPLNSLNLANHCGQGPKPRECAKALIIYFQFPAISTQTYSSALNSFVSCLAKADICTLPSVKPFPGSATLSISGNSKAALTKPQVGMTIGGYAKRKWGLSEVKEKWEWFAGSTLLPSETSDSSNYGVVSNLLIPKSAIGKSLTVRLTATSCGYKPKIISLTMKSKVTKQSIVYSAKNFRLVLMDVEVFDGREEETRLFQILPLDTSQYRSPDVFFWDVSWVGLNKDGEFEIEPMGGENNELYFYGCPGDVEYVKAYFRAEVRDVASPLMSVVIKNPCDY